LESSIIPEILAAVADESVRAPWPAARAKSDHQMDEKRERKYTHLCVWLAAVAAPTQYYQDARRGTPSLMA
jgi:hypothetical protein